MPIDAERAKAYAFTPFEFEIERGRLRAFAAATGSTDPVYVDLEAAKSAGHRDLPVPPTFFFSMDLEAPDPFGYVQDLGIDLRTVLHGEQTFDYHQLVHAGDVVTLSARIVDVFSKKDGALEFLVKKVAFTRADELVAKSTTVIVVRNQRGATA